MRAAIDRQAQVPQAPGLQAPVSQALAPWAPQMVHPLCQPLPSSRNQLATPYQQAVQLPSKTKGLKVTFDSSADQPAATGDKDADDCGRQRTQGRDGNTWPASHSSGMQEKSSIRMTSKQTHAR